MSEPILAADFRVGAPSASYDILRVTSDPRVVGLTADLGTIVEYIGSQGSVMLAKYTTWDTGWRAPGEGPVYPATSASFLGATKITPGALYVMDQLLGDVFDVSGNGNTLTVANTPTFQRSIENKVGIWYDGATDRHSANVNNPVSGSFLWGCEVALINDPGAAGFNNFLGRSDAGAQGFILYYNAGVDIILRDTVGTLVFNGFGASSITAMTTNPRVPYLITVQVDRVANRARARMSRGGAAFATLDYSIAGLGSLAGSVGPLFGMGSIPVFNGGGWVPYGFYATGAQTEGSNVLRDLAVGLGWEV